MLKLASLGMFSFSLGQSILCIGRNRTSCEAYGYNACDYQVAVAWGLSLPFFSARPPSKTRQGPVPAPGVSLSPPQASPL